MELLQLGAALAAIIAAGTSTGYAQELAGPPANPKYKYSTEMPPGIAAPSKIESRLGTLNLFDGFPDEASAEKLWDALDFQRAVQAYLLAIPAVNQAANRNAMRTLGSINQTVPIWEDLVDSRTVGLTFNDQTIYSWPWMDLSKGTIVMEVPPGVLGLANDMWYRFVINIGIVGPDKGNGGKYLFVPPGYEGELPESGYFIVKSRTFNLFAGWRTFLEDGSPKPGVERNKNYTKIYPLADAGKPAPELTFANLSGKPFNMENPADYRFWELLNEVVQEEPSESLDEVRLGYFASVGIRKGKPFAPDARMKKLLTEAAAVGDAMARTIAFHPREPEFLYYPNSAWQLPFVGGYQFQWSPGVLNLDAYSYYYWLATGVTPAMEEKMVGKGSQYAWAARDADGKALDGGKNYKLHLPPNIPAKRFCSVILYGDQTRSMIQTDQRFPSVSSQNKDLIVNGDGSVDVYFGPEAPAVKEPNWVQTIPGTGWNTLLRLYDPLEPWFNKTWRPGEIELVE